MEKIIRARQDKDVLTISLCGHIDSTNAPDAEALIDALCAKQPDCAVVLDAHELTYISSAGLRVILRLRKSRPDLRIINVSPDVYEIFSMTGFTELMRIEKAYRVLSVEGCEVIGQGANGKVYRLDRDTIIKVYLRPDSLEDIHRERELARRAFILGIPTAIPYDVVKVGDGYGSVFELLNAKSFSRLIAAAPQKADEYIALYTQLLKKIHSTSVKPGEMPDIKVTAAGWANDLQGQLPPRQWEKLRRLIAAVPDDTHMIHGDYHTKNVMMQNGEVLLIDMDTLSFGHPVFEFANMFNAYIGYEELLPGEEVGRFLGLDATLVRQIWGKTLRLYFNTDDVRSIEEKAMVIGYMRILRRTLRRNGTTPEGKRLIEHCRARLAELLERVDTLQF